MHLIDTHCHIDVTAFDHDRDQVIAQCISSGINKIIVPAISAAGWDNLLHVCRSRKNLYPALGLHPVFIDQHKTAHLVALENYLAREKPLAIGEIGLDYYIKQLDKAVQKQFFHAQLAIAENASLPVLLHVRKAHEEVLLILKRTPVTGGICHAFNGSLQQAHRYIDLGFKLGFGGMITYARSIKIRKLAKEIPLESIVLETDAPDMTVAKHHGDRNSPAYLTDCLKSLAEIRMETPEFIAEQTTRNAKEVLGL